MARVLIIGSGASGVHFALTALRRGHDVIVLDVGFARPRPVAPNATFSELKEVLDDPVEYFIGRDGAKVVYPSPNARPFGFPPEKGYVFRRPPAFALSSRGIDPYISFARGGLAEVWTGGSYEYDEHDLAEFPFPAGELRAGYAEVARRIGVTGSEDDLARFMPLTADYLDPLPLDPHSERLLAAYSQKKTRLNRELGFFLGRSRVATLTRDHGERKACAHLGRCLWGCPRDSLYTPSLTLAECELQPGFRYCSGRLVRRLEFDARGHVGCVVSTALDGGDVQSTHADLYVLAAGTLATSKIYLDSCCHAGDRTAALTGLMDNPHAMIPFLTLDMIGRPVNTASYQYHLLAFALAGEAANGAGEAHGQITTLKAAAAHPIVQSLPFDLRSSVSAFRALRAGLAVANVWTAAQRSEGNRVSIRPLPASDETELVIEYDDVARATEMLARQVRSVRRALSRLGCIAPRSMVQMLPVGSSGRYGGTLPMTARAEPHTCDAYGRVRGFDNLVVADGSGFPALPSKNVTFTLMANAVRIASALL